MTREGVLFHAKHAFMPNSLGYCGPDERGLIRDEIESGTASDKVVDVLRKFEAAYPFLGLIARNTGREAFDYEVPEAYWIGNELLEQVPPTDFYGFSHRELLGKDPGKVRRLFKELDGSARPHHSFYVMSTYAASSALNGPSLENESARKIASLIDSCRISWGKVMDAGRDELRVTSRPLELSEGRLELARPRITKVRYDRAVEPFARVRKGDVVSIHWGYACDVLTSRQALNIAKYTDADLTQINRLLASRR